jgi:hypothetical protein
LADVTKKWGDMRAFVVRVKQGNCYRKGLLGIRQGFDGSEEGLEGDA